MSSNLLKSCAVAAISAASLWPVAASAQSSVSGQAQTRVEGGSRIEKLGDLHFGDIIPGDSGGSITLDISGAVSTTGSVIAAGGAPEVAEFLLSRRFFVDFPVYQGPAGSDTIQLTHTSFPGETMTLRNFVTDFNRPGFLGLPAYLFQTEYDFRVTGTLDVGANQRPGSYLGFFTVSVDYN